MKVDRVVGSSNDVDWEASRFWGHSGTVACSLHCCSRGMGDSGVEWEGVRGGAIPFKCFVDCSAGVAFGSLFGGQAHSNL
ncbi:BirA family transcriptional regulator, biotin operon repressor [Sesbania bispinosa]|nr:BirA family transcriptional regulator, biotin operon repressor [Sesbania bispinosa]